MLSPLRRSMHGRGVRIPLRLSPLLAGCLVWIAGRGDGCGWWCDVMPNHGFEGTFSIPTLRKRRAENRNCRVVVEKRGVLFLDSSPNCSHTRSLSRYSHQTAVFRPFDGNISTVNVIGDGPGSRASVPATTAYASVPTTSAWASRQPASAKASLQPAKLKPAASP